jgi:hypothetical protein
VRWVIDERLHRHDARTDRASAGRCAADSAERFEFRYGFRNAD